MNRRVLIVSPHFPPMNAPDHQRVRMSLPYFGEFGWDPIVLTVRPEEVEGVFDPVLERTIPSQIQIIRTKAFSGNISRRLGLGNLGLRSLPYLRRAGDRILKQEKIDLVYFSTTVFPVMSLGPRWRARYGVPYILDFQDPWLSDYYKRPGAPLPPGGNFKYAFSQTVARMLEPNALRHASHIISVSPDYPQMLLRRYPTLQEDQFTVLPFGAPKRDFECLDSLNIRQSIFNPADGKRHWAYVGRAGGDMAVALRILFSTLAIARKQNPEVWNQVRLHFIGTSYAPGGRGVKTVEPVAREFGVADLVEEHAQRIPYFEAMKVLTDCHAILLIGSDDPGYTASKLYPCILARKPILGIFHKDSSVVGILRDCNAGQVVTFDSNCDETLRHEQARKHLDWLFSIPIDYVPNTDWQAFDPYTAREMTRKQCELFDQSLGVSY